MSDERRTTGDTVPGDDVPGRLARALRDAHPRPAPPPPERERELLAAARSRLAGADVARAPDAPAPPAFAGRPARGLPRVAPWFPVGLAAAVLVLWLVLGGRGDALDVDGSGRVDVLDAFAVARGVRDDATREGWDVNGDGAVDARDVDVLLAAAVRIER